MAGFCVLRNQYTFLYTILLLCAINAGKDKVSQLAIRLAERCCMTRPQLDCLQGMHFYSSSLIEARQQSDSHYSLHSWLAKTGEKPENSSHNL